MGFTYESMYAMSDEMASFFGVTYVIYQVLAGIICITGYFFRSAGLYTIAKRRGIPNPWLSWLPLVKAWIIGSISDQFRYVTKGQIRNKRKSMLILQSVTIVCTVACHFMLLAGFGNLMLSDRVWGWSAALANGFGILVGALCVALVGLCISIVSLVIACMAMYDLYTSADPASNVLLLVLNIIFPIAEPYFIFFNRKKDLGMPPRCDAAVTPAAAVPRPVIREPWENNPES